MKGSVRQLAGIVFIWTIIETHSAQTAGFHGESQTNLELSRNLTIRCSSNSVCQASAVNDVGTADANPADPMSVDALNNLMSENA